MINFKFLQGGPSLKGLSQDDIEYLEWREFINTRPPREVIIEGLRIRTEMRRNRSEMRRIQQIFERNRTEMQRIRSEIVQGLRIRSDIRQIQETFEQNRDELQRIRTEIRRIRFEIQQNKADMRRLCLTFHPIF